MSPDKLIVGNNWCENLPKFCGSNLDVSKIYCGCTRSGVKVGLVLIANI